MELILFAASAFISIIAIAYTMYINRRTEIYLDVIALDQIAIMHRITAWHNEELDNHPVAQYSYKLGAMATNKAAFLRDKHNITYTKIGN